MTASRDDKFIGHKPATEVLATSHLLINPLSLVDLTWIGIFAKMPKAVFKVIIGMSMLCTTSGHIIIGIR